MTTTTDAVEALTEILRIGVNPSFRNQYGQYASFIVDNMVAKGFTITRQQDCVPSSGCVYADIKAYPPDGRCINAPALRYTAIPTGHDRGYMVTEPSMSEAELEREARKVMRHAFPSYVGGACVQSQNNYSIKERNHVAKIIELAKKYRG